MFPTTPLTYPWCHPLTFKYRLIRFLKVYLPSEQSKIFEECVISFEIIPLQMHMQAIENPTEGALKKVNCLPQLMGPRANLASTEICSGLKQCDHESFSLFLVVASWEFWSRLFSCGLKRLTEYMGQYILIYFQQGKKRNCFYSLSTKVLEISLIGLYGPNLGPLLSLGQIISAHGFETVSR